MELLDLTLPLDESMFVYCESDYSDPEFSVSSWCTIEAQGFEVSRLVMGTQTGTHVAAPAHFRSGGKTIDQISLDNLCGSYAMIDFSGDHNQISDEELRKHRILFIRLGKEGWQNGQFNRLISLNHQLWVVEDIADEKPWPIHKALADNDIFLVENLEPGAAGRVRPEGEIFVLPLKLKGLSGAPARVIIRQ